MGSMRTLVERTEQRSGDVGPSNTVFNAAWDAVTSSFPVTPKRRHSTRLQVAHTLDDILEIAPRHLAAECIPH